MSDSRAVLGTMALSAANVVKLALQIIVLPIMARLLGPAAFGLVAFAMPFILLANMFCDAGLGNALVRESEPSRALESTVFWLSVGIGVGLALILSLLAWPLAPLLSQPALAPILMALSPILILSGGLSVANARISRERNFAVFAVGDFISAVASAAAGIGAALAGFGAWSLVIQQVTLWGVKVAWVLPASRFRPQLYCAPALARPYLSFGLHSVGANLSDFAGKNAASLVVGGMLGVAALGHYAMAYQIARIPEMIISGPIYLAIFTSVARTAGSGQMMVQMTIRNLRMLVTGLAPLFCGVGLVARPAVALLLGPKWAETAPILSALAPACFFLCLYSAIGATFMGLGRSDRQFRMTAALSVALVAGSVIGGRYSGVGVAIGLDLAAAALAPFYLAALAATLGTPVRSILTVLAGPAMASLVMVVLVLAVRSQTAGAPPMVALALDAVVGAVTYTLMIAALGGRQLVDDMRGFLPQRAVA